MSDVRPFTFSYESPKRPRLPFSTVRIPDYDDIAQSLPNFLRPLCDKNIPLVIVTHSQGGLILQRFLSWMIMNGRGRELSIIKCIVMLSCPNEGSEYLASVRAVVGLSRHPQASQLSTLAKDVLQARRVVLQRVVHVHHIDDFSCPIAIHVYSGRSDNVVLRQSAQSVFPNAETLPGDHFSILDPRVSGKSYFGNY